MTSNWEEQLKEMKRRRKHEKIGVIEQKVFRVPGCTSFYTKISSSIWPQLVIYLKNPL